VRRRSSGDVHHDTESSSSEQECSPSDDSEREEDKKEERYRKMLEYHNIFYRKGKYAPGGLGAGETFAWTQVIRSSDIAKDSVQKSPELLEPFKHEGEHRSFSR
jgi:hypothetical protein